MCVRRPWLTRHVTENGADLPVLFSPRDTLVGQGIGGIVVISQVLNRKFVTDRLREMQDYLGAPPATRRAAPSVAPEAETVTADDLEEALIHINMAMAAEAHASSGQTSFDKSAPSERRGAAP